MRKKSTPTHRVCPGCNNELPKENFGHNRHCSACRRENYLQERYGISTDDYTALLDQQDGVCAVCRGPQQEGKGMLWINYDNLSNRIRGLLCARCNMIVGAQVAVALDPALADQAKTFLENAASPATSQD